SRISRHRSAASGTCTAGTLGLPASSRGIGGRRPPPPRTEQRPRLHYRRRPPIPRLDAGRPSVPAVHVHLLSNGNYHVAITNSGAGYSRWRDLAVTRWHEDPTRDPWGSFCYVRDVPTGAFWSLAHQPTLVLAQGYEAIFSQGRAEFRRRDGDLQTHVEISISPEDDIELRRVSITNRGRSAHTLELTSFAEVVLAPRAADA